MGGAAGARLGVTLMAPEKSPAFQFYPDLFLTDEDQVVMSLEEAGAYIRLMCYCWREQTIPNDAERLARLVGTTPLRMKKLWPAIVKCFSPDDAAPNRLRHRRLDSERAKQQAWREKSAEGGRKAQAGRKHPTKGGSTTPEPSLEGCSNTPSLSPSPTPVKTDPPRARRVDGHQGLVDHYFARFTAIVGSPPKFAGPEGKLLKDLLSGRDSAEVQAAMDAMFDCSEQWVRESGYGMGFFSRQFNKFLAASHRHSRKATGPQHADDWWAECQHEPKCETGPMHRQRVQMDTMKGAA
jgi:uncharacterized protein YdaU (DUF1376 family)